MIAAIRADIHADMQPAVGADPGCAIDHDCPRMRYRQSRPEYIDGDREPEFSAKAFILIRRDQAQDPIFATIREVFELAHSALKSPYIVAQQVPERPGHGRRDTVGIEIKPVIFVGFDHAMTGRA
jgi:hypothetical protein